MLPHRYENGRMRHGYEAQAPDRLTIVVDRGGFVWEPDSVLSALRRFAHSHGRPPRSEELNSQGTGANPLRGDARPLYPSAVTVAKYFGSFNAGLTTAGLTPRDKTDPRIPRRVCRRGHRMAETGYIDSAGARRCLICRRAQLRSNKQLARARKETT